MTKERTIKLESYFGEQEFTLKEFQKRWSGPTNEIWAFFWRLDPNGLEKLTPPWQI